MIERNQFERGIRNLFGGLVFTETNSPNLISVIRGID